MLTEEQNLRVAIRWFFTHDITPLPHLFRALWLFWQKSDRMPEGRAWIDELRLRTDPLDDRARAEVLFTWAVTACAVGDDDGALVAGGRHRAAPANGGRPVARERVAVGGRVDAADRR